MALVDLLALVGGQGKIKDTNYLSDPDATVTGLKAEMLESLNGAKR